MESQILLGDNIEVLPLLPHQFARLIYIDPPFNSGKRQKRGDISYEDRASSTEDYVTDLIQRIIWAKHCLTLDGSIYVHLDWHAVHEVKCALDRMLGTDHFMGEIIWAYDYGARSKRKWPTKHDTLLWYVLNPKSYVFNYEAMDRIPYMAPGLVGAEKAKRGKTPTDVWWQTIVPTNSREKTGYPTQKPVALLNRIVKVHTMPGDAVLDFFAGSGTTGEAAQRNGRRFVLIDSNPVAVEIAKKRLSVL